MVEVASNASIAKRIVGIKVFLFIAVKLLNFVFNILASFWVWEGGVTIYFF